MINQQRKRGCKCVTVYWFVWIDPFKDQPLGDLPSLKEFTLLGEVFNPLQICPYQSDHDRQQEQE